MSHMLAFAVRNRTLTAPFILSIILVGCTAEEPTEDQVQPISPAHTVTFDGLGVDLDADGTYLAVAAKHHGVMVFETTQANRPLKVGSVDLPLVYKALLNESNVFALDEQHGLSAIDLRNLDALALTPTLSTIELYGYVADAIWRDRTLVLASEALGLSEYSVERSMRLVESAHTFPSSPAEGATTIALAADRIIAAGYRGDLSVFQWQPGKLPILDSWLSTPHVISDLTCHDELCYAAGMGEGLFVYRIAYGTQPEFIGQVEFKRAIDKVYIDEDKLLVSYLGPGDQSGWHVMHLRKNATPILAGSVRASSPVRDFARVDHYVYVLLEKGEIQIYNRRSLP